MYSAQYICTTVENYPQWGVTYLHGRGIAIMHVESFVCTHDAKRGSFVHIEGGTGFYFPLAVDQAHLCTT